MSQQSAIEWTDATWNPVRGCVKVSPGCAHCYAETFAERWRGVPGHSYAQGFDLRLVPEKLAEPLRWKTPRRVFVNSMSDLFQDGVPDEYIDQVFAVMALAPEHTFQVLTKRAERLQSYLTTSSRHAAIVAAMDMPSWLPAGRPFPRVPENWPMPNVWLGVSVENQHFANERIPLLLQTPAAVRFISAEPLLGPVDLRCVAPRDDFWVDALDTPDASRRLQWVIVGGESGVGARPCDLASVRALVAQCGAAGVPCFVKQLGAHPQQRVMYGPATFAADQVVHSEALRLTSRKGGDMTEWPADLRVREWP
jgi:protein gp37